MSSTTMTQWRAESPRPDAARPAERDPGRCPVSGRPYDRWRDAEGVHISDGYRVEQIAVSKEYGVLPSRLGKHGEVAGVRPHLLRVTSVISVPAPEWRWPVTVRWGCSPLDRRHHAVDESCEHPRSALRAECGHLLAVLSTWLSEEPAGRTAAPAPRSRRIAR